MARGAGNLLLHLRTSRVFSNAFHFPQGRRSLVLESGKETKGGLINLGGNETAVHISKIFACRVGFGGEVAPLLPNPQLSGPPRWLLEVLGHFLLIPQISGPVIILW